MAYTRYISKVSKECIIKSVKETTATVTLPAVELWGETTLLGTYISDDPDNLEAFLEVQSYLIKKASSMKLPTQSKVKPND